MKKIAGGGGSIFSLTARGGRAYDHRTIAAPASSVAAVRRIPHQRSPEMLNALLRVLGLAPEQESRPASKRKSHPAPKRPNRRPLRLESLEDRLVPAPIMVTNLHDDGDGSLRQAIRDANSAGGTQVIDCTGIFGVI